ncbi:DUF456 domain-containing protein [Chlorobaculum sp. MV4-Y]|jgi:uncharacterized protein YqgC (DUF456 family)|uniref:DUF456 domain-containing protein n=1 Tax=Chlorobaculum sp. MV4-Y TaxID=2976335 RepID=UPI0021AFF8B9|nr:DUF456 domain-containing protein [Chlorobaculum sp. MV4-Y]UWX57956.1 DUF456 domain-containing protein [Chlorobaculum sp. MV4-Y]
MDTTTILWITSALLLIAGFAGLVLPALPGVLLIFAGLVFAAWAENFAYVGWGTITILGVLTAAAYLIDFFAGLFGAKRFGAGKYGVIGAAIGTVTGLLFSLPGIIIGPFIGAVLGELYAQKDLRTASTAGFGVWIGMAIGIAVRVAVAFVMVGVFLVVRFV